MRCRYSLRSDVGGSDEFVLAELDGRAVGDRRLVAARMQVERQASVLVDHIDNRRLQLIGAQMLCSAPAQQLGGRDFGSMTGRLAGAEIAAVTKDREKRAKPQTKTAFRIVFSTLMGDAPITRSLNIRT